MNRLKPILAFFLLGGLAPAQQYVISNVAGLPGVQGYFGDGSAALGSQLTRPFFVSVDSKSNVFLTDIYNHRVREVTASDSKINTIAGTGLPGFDGDNAAATDAKLTDPHAAVSDGNGIVYISDTSSSRIRKIDSKGVITTFAGTGARGYSGDGSDATKAVLYFPAGLALDGSGNLYVSDYGNSTIRKITPGGAISTVAGTGNWGYSGDGGSAAKADVANPVAIAVDSAGNVYIADTGSNTIRRIGADGNIRTILSNVSPQSVAADSAGNVYFVEASAPVVKKLLPSGSVVTIAGTGAYGYTGDPGSPALAAQLNFPSGVASTPAGVVFIADTNNQLIRRLDVAPISVAAVVNSASGIQSGISPGEIVTLYGSGMGPSALTLFTVANGAIGTQLAGVTVTFQGVPAPLIYVSAGQVAAIAPYAIANSPTADVVVTYQGQSSLTATVPVAAAAPGIFTADATGAGQAAAVNAIDGTINSASNPVKIGAFLSLYVTGEGQTTPAGTDGKLANAAPYPAPLLPVTVQVGGLPAVVTYKGAAPTLVAGLMQVNVQIPAGVQPGSAVPVTVNVGTASSPAGVTIAVSQ